MFTFAFDNPSPATIVIITGDRDFAYAAATLKLRGYEIIVIAPSNIAHSSLKMQAGRLYDWQRDVAGVLKSETVPSSPEYFEPATQPPENAYCKEITYTIPPSKYSPSRGSRVPLKYPKTDISSRPPSVFPSTKATPAFSFHVPGEVPPSSGLRGHDDDRPKSTTVTENRRGILKNSKNAKLWTYEHAPKAASPYIQAEDYAEDPNAEDGPEIEESANASFKSLVHIDSPSSGTKPRVIPTYEFFAGDSDEADDDSLEPFSEPLPLSESNLASFPSHLQEDYKHRKLEFGNLGAHEGTVNVNDDDEGCGCGICKRSSSAGLDGSGDDPEPYEQIGMHLYIYDYLKSPFIYRSAR